MSKKGFKEVNIISIIVLIIFVQVFTSCRLNSDKTDDLQMSTTSVKSVATESSEEIEQVVLEVEKQISESSNGRLIFKQGELEVNKDYIVPYIDYDEMFLKKGEKQYSSGKYSDISYDNKINWKSEELYRYKGVSKAEEMLDEITIDGKNINIRDGITFEDIDEDYAVFDLIDFSKITRNILPCIIEDIETGNKLYITNNQGSDENISALDIYNKANIFEIAVSVNTKSSKLVTITTICGLYPDVDIMPNKEIKVGGLGLMSTTNEFYEKFKAPDIIIGYSTMSTFDYAYRDELNGVKYSIYMDYGGEKYDPRAKSENNVKNLSITNIFIGFKGIE